MLEFIKIFINSFTIKIRIEVLRFLQHYNRDYVEKTNVLDVTLMTKRIVKANILVLKNAIKNKVAATR